MSSTTEMYLGKMTVIKFAYTKEEYTIFKVFQREDK